MKEKTVVDGHLQFCYSFIRGIIQYNNTLKDLYEINKSASIVDIINKMEDEYGCSNYTDLITEQDVTEFLKDEWRMMQSLMAYHILKKFNIPDDSFIEYINIRDLLEVLMNEKIDGTSAYSRIINFLEIPIDLIPRKYINTLCRADEFVSASYMIQELMSGVGGCDDFTDISQFRSEMTKCADNIIKKLHDKEFFGTYDNAYFVELIMCYKLNFPYIGPLYITSDFPKNHIEYDKLVEKVNSLWEIYKYMEGGGDADIGDIGS